MKRPLLGIAFTFSLGILFGKIVNIPLFYAFGCTLIFVFLSILFIKSKTKFLIVVFLGFFFLGALALKGYDSVPKDHIKNIIQIDESSTKRILVQGRILNKPDKTKTHYNKDRQRFLLAIKAVKAGRDWQPSSGILSVSVFKRRPDFQYGNEVILEGRLFLMRGATNPGQFDYRKFLERKKIFYGLKSKDKDFVKIIGHGFKNPITVFAYKAKESLKARIDKFIPAKEGLMLKAILLGERQDVDEDIKDTFMKTGTVHILSISGLHVGLLVFLFILLFKLARVPFKIQVFILTFLLVSYCIMVGNRPSIIRSTIMILVFLFGRLLKREQDLLNSLAFSALAILFFRPQQLFDIGFQLSFLTVGSIIYFTPELEGVLIKKRGKTKGKLNLYFLRAVSVSFCAWLGSALLVARYFNIVSPITVIANLFVIPLIFFILAISLTFLVFGVFSSTLAIIFSQTCTLGIQILLKIIAIFSQLPFSYFRIKSPAWLFIIGFYVFLLLFVNRKHLRIKTKYFLIAGLVFVNCFVWHKVLFKQESLLKITFLDVGKADAFVVQFPKGGTMLIDGAEGYGPDMGRLVVSRFLASEGINRIDMVVATHPHTDHIGGLATILKNFKVRYFVENGEKGRNRLYVTCQELIKQKGIKKFIVQEGTDIKGFSGIEMRILNPPDKKFHRTNDNSLVLRLKHKDFSVIFCGDIEERAARSLSLRQAEEMASTVLKVPHHGGSLGDAGREFIKRVNPEIAVISTGGKKVSKSILLQLNALGINVYRTDALGAIRVSTDGENYRIKGHKNN